MPHVNAPLTPTGRLRMVRRHLDDGIPKAHVAAEFRVSRPTVATWVARYLAAGEAGLADRPSVPRRSPQRTPMAVVELIECLRRERKWSARRIHRHLLGLGHELHLRTVGRWLNRLGISRLRDLTPDGDDLRRPPQRIRAGWPGHMVHLDVKKVGRIPDGGGWRAHGRGSTATKTAKRGPAVKVGYTYLHSAVDGFSRLAYTEALEDERAVTTIGFFCRARAFFAIHGIEKCPVTGLLEAFIPRKDESHGGTEEVPGRVARARHPDGGGGPAGPGDEGRGAGADRPAAGDQPGNAAELGETGRGR